jgi:NTE family protein
MLGARGNLETLGRRMGSFSTRRAASGRGPTLEERYQAIRQRLGDATWPDAGRLKIVAVDAKTGAVRVFDGSDGVSLLDAVTSSCAVPGVYPPVPIEGRTYIDGGVRSSTNADLAKDCEVAVALAPMDRSIGPIRGARQLLGDTRSLVITPDETARASFGNNVLDPAARVGTALAGHAQAARVVDQVRELWG